MNELNSDDGLVFLHIWSSLSRRVLESLFAAAFEQHRMMSSRRGHQTNVASFNSELCASPIDDDDSMSNDKALLND